MQPDTLDTCTTMLFVICSTQVKTTTTTITYHYYPRFYVGVAGCSGTNWQVWISYDTLNFYPDSPWPDLSGRIDHNTTHGHGFCLASIFAVGVRVHIWYSELWTINNQQKMSTILCNSWKTGRPGSMKNKQPPEGLSWASKGMTKRDKNTTLLLYSQVPSVKGALY